MDAETHNTPPGEHKCLCDFVFVCLMIFFCKPVDAIEGIFPRASCFDGGVSNARVGCDWFSSKRDGMFIANDAGVGLDFVPIDGQWWLAACLRGGLEVTSLDVLAAEV